MLRHEDRQRCGRALLWVMLVLLVIAAVIVALRPPGFITQLFDFEHYASDQTRLEKLRTAELAAAAPMTSAPGPATDWPQWRGPRSDGIAPESIRTDWPAEGLPVLWRAKVGRGYSSLAIAGGRAYTLMQEEGDEIVVCWDAESGAEQWRRRYPAPFPKGYPGPRATPSVVAGKVYTLGATGKLHCLNAANGDVEWHVDLVKEYGARMPEWGIACSPLVDGDKVFVIVGGSKGNGIAAFDRVSGKVLWTALDDIAGYSSPILATLAEKRQLVAFTGKALVGLSPEDGSEYWRYPWDTKFDVNAATPIVAGNYVFISSNYGKGCALVEITSDAGNLQAQRVYEHNRMRNHFATSILYKDHIYGFDDDLFACMDLRTGRPCWKQRGFGKGSVLMAGEHLIVLGDRGKLALVVPSGEKFEQKAAFQALPATMAGPSWTVPVVANGRLYVRGDEELICYDVRIP